MTMDRPLVILGGTGDLTGRLLLPSLAHLVESGRAAPRVIAVDNKPYDDNTFREWAARELSEHACQDSQRTRDALVDALSYVSGDVTDSKVLRTALDRGSRPVVYLALPNAIFAETLTALREAIVPEGATIAVEKPFGADRADAARLNVLLHDLVPEHATFRIDHFIAKRTVLNILGLRFGNRLFEPVWNNQHIDKVEIVYDETLGLEERAGYYDKAGALRDMLQNHLLQVLALAAMEPPRSLEGGELPARKADVLRAVRAIEPGDAVRARYAAGRIGDKVLTAYSESDGVDPSRGTETYAEAIAYIDNWRWAGVPFRMRTGKALAAERQEIRIHLRSVPHSPFTGGIPQPNVLTLSLDNDAMALEINLNGEADPFDLEKREFCYLPNDPVVPAYATVLASLIDGDGALSISGTEAEESWRIIEGLRDSWDANDTDLLEYPAGSDGPVPPASWKSTKRGISNR